VRESTLLDTEPVVISTDQPVVVVALQEVALQEEAETDHQAVEIDPQVAVDFLQAAEALPSEDTPDPGANIGTMGQQEVVVDHQEVEVEEEEVDQAVPI
jgi:hypothetical protein